MHLQCLLCCFELFFSVPQTQFPLPPLFYNVPGTALFQHYGAMARAAYANTWRKGWCEASKMRTRRVLRTMAAPILSNRPRMVAALAGPSFVPLSAGPRKAVTQV